MVFVTISSLSFAVLRKGEKVSPGFWGARREHGLFELGNRATKTRYLREPGNINHFRDQKLRTNLEVIWGTQADRTPPLPPNPSWEALRRCLIPSNGIYP